MSNKLIYLTNLKSLEIKENNLLTCTTISGDVWMRLVEVESSSNYFISFGVKQLYCVTALKPLTYFFNGGLNRGKKMVSLESLIEDFHIGIEFDLKQLPTNVILYPRDGDYKFMLKMSCTLVNVEYFLIINSIKDMRMDETALIMDKAIDNLVVRVSKLEKKIIYDTNYEIQEKDHQFKSKEQHKIMQESIQALSNITQLKIEENAKICQDLSTKIINLDLKLDLSEKQNQKLLEKIEELEKNNAEKQAISTRASSNMMISAVTNHEIKASMDKNERIEMGFDNDRKKGDDSNLEISNYSFQIEQNHLSVAEFKGVDVIENKSTSLKKIRKKSKQSEIALLKKDGVFFLGNLLCDRGTFKFLLPDNLDAALIMFKNHSSGRADKLFKFSNSNRAFQLPGMLDYEQLLAFINLKQPYHSNFSDSQMLLLKDKLSNSSYRINRQKKIACDNLLSSNNQIKSISCKKLESKPYISAEVTSALGKITSKQHVCDTFKDHQSSVNSDNGLKTSIKPVATNRNHSQVKLFPLAHSLVSHFHIQQAKKSLISPQVKKQKRISKCSKELPILQILTSS